MGAMGIAAKAQALALPATASVDAEVDLGTANGGYLLQARLNINLPGIDREKALAIIEAAHNTCPYSKATRGNINVTLNLV